LRERAYNFWLGLLIFHTLRRRPLGDTGMKSLIVYYFGGHWIGEEVSWKRAGSGTYRETARIEIPQSKAEIEKFAAENRFVIDWRGTIPADRAPAGAPA
jgi:hypothetical protein